MSKTWPTTMAILKTKRRKNATGTIKTGIEGQAKDRVTVNREITVSTTIKVITLNKIMETPTVIKVEVIVVTPETDPATTTTMGEVIKTETETIMHTDKMDTNKAIKAKATATPNADTTHGTKNDAEKIRHTQLTPTTDKIHKTLHTYIHVLSLCHLYSFTRYLKSHEYKLPKDSFLMHSSHNFTPK
jgi:hypothetical protein